MRRKAGSDEGDDITVWRVRERVTVMVMGRGEKVGWYDKVIIVPDGG